MRMILSLTALLVVAGCSNTPACMREQPYHHAEEFPPLRAPAGMTVPDPDPNLRVPEVEHGTVAAFPAEQEDGENKEEARQRCLSSPPPLPDEGGSESGAG